MPTVGIDFGSRRLRVALGGPGSPALIHHRYETRRMPFVIRNASPGLRITSLKRLLDFETPFPVPPTGINSLDLLAEILREVREDAAGNAQTNCVMAIPPCFSQRQRAALRAAGEKAGFQRVRLLDDTLAALLACREQVAGRERILVYAWGAGSFAAAVYRTHEAGFRPLALEGNRELGGDDLDSLLTATILAAMRHSALDLDSQPDSTLLWSVIDEGERAKKELAEGKDVHVRLEALPGWPPGMEADPVDFSPREFDQAFAPLQKETWRLTAEALRAAGGNPPDAIITQGGLAGLYRIRADLRHQFHLAPLHAGDGAVALGCVRYGESLGAAEWQKADRGVAPAASVAPAPAPRAEASPPASWADNFVPGLDAAEREYAAGRLEEAIAGLEKVFAELGKFSGDLYRRAAAGAVAAGRVDAALATLGKAHSHDRSNRLVAAELAQLCAQRAAELRKQPAAALPLCEQGIEAIRAISNAEQAYAPLLARLHQIKCVVLCDTGRLLDAERAIAESVRLQPSEPAYQHDLDRVRSAVKKGALRSHAAAAAGAPATGRARPGRNDPCPCGSGRKYKKCCERGQ